MVLRVVIGIHDAEYDGVRNKNPKVRFHTADRGDLSILSVYEGDDPNFIEVDLGDEEDA